MKPPNATNAVWDNDPNCVPLEFIVTPDLMPARRIDPWLGRVIYNEFYKI